MDILKKTSAAEFTKDHFVIIDAIGIEKSQKTDSRPLEKKPGLNLEEVLEHIAMGNKDEDLLTTLDNRLIRLDKQINDKEKAAFSEKANGQPKNKLIALVSLIRTVSATLTPFDKTVDKNFQDWIFKKQAGPTKYTTKQVHWLRMIKDYIANLFHVDKDDFELDPFNKASGLGKFHQLFREDYEKILKESNEELVA